MLPHDRVKIMKEQTHSAILPELPIVGTLKLTSRDGKTLASIDVVKKQKPQGTNVFFEKCYQELLAFLTGKKKKINIKLDLSNLTPFQQKVLQEMGKIPYGHVVTYKDLAAGMQSRGVQAIGSACGRNPFLLIYPCHRVVGSNGMGGFAHGLKMKAELLKLENRP
jgi:methylated-DNA-[protein]-cysteine S-methyltransferase